ncbi:MAG: HEPN domain-containing protein [Actinopolymorphaceae bacterium]|jgi:HEPN domain-containing protein
MSRWHAGEADIERFVAEAGLQDVSGAQADGTGWLTRARRTVQTAASLVDTDPESAYILAYDAARYGCTALLAQQGLRPTTTGGHLVVERAARAQFGDPFKAYGMLRRRRNELEYPSHPGDSADEQEAEEAVVAARGIIDAAERLLPHLGFFTT